MLLRNEFEHPPEDIRLAISDDGRCTAVMMCHAPDSYISVFETEHLLHPAEWADPGFDPIDSWGEEGIVEDIAFSPDGKTLTVRWLFGAAETWDFDKGKTDI